MYIDHIDLTFSQIARAMIIITIFMFIYTCLDHGSERTTNINVITLFSSEIEPLVLQVNPMTTTSTITEFNDIIHL